MSLGWLRRVLLVAALIGLTVGPALGAQADGVPHYQIYLPLVSQNVNAGLPTATATITPTPTATTAPVQVSFLLSSATATVTTNNHSVTLSFPPGAIAGATGETVSVSLAPLALGPGQVLAIQINVALDGAPITQFGPQAPLSVTVRYDPAAVAAAGLRESDLQLSLVDDLGQTTLLPTTIDLVNHTATANIPHLTALVLGGAGPTPTITSTTGPTDTPTSTASPTDVPSSVTPTTSPILTGTPTGTITPTPSVTESATASTTFTATNSPTSTLTVAATATATDSATPSNTPSATSPPATTPTITGSPTSTPTTSLPATPSSTAGVTDSPTLTSTPTASPTPSPTTSPTASATATATASDTPTDTPKATGTNTPTQTSTSTDSPTASSTATATSTKTPSETDTPSETPPPSTTATSSYTVTASPTSTATASPTATATQTPIGPGDPRFAVIADSSASAPHTLSVLGASWWYAFGQNTPSGPANGVAQIAVNPTGTCCVEVPAATLQAGALSNPGAYWIIGNEVNVGGQDSLSPSQYATELYYYASTIKGADPTAHIVGPNFLNWNATCLSGCGGNPPGGPLGSTWVPQLLSAWATQYGGEIPIDVWAIHLYAVDWYNTPMDNPTDINAVEQDLAGFSNYLAGIPGEKSKPIWVTEFGILWANPGFPNIVHGGCAKPIDSQGDCFAPAGAFDTTGVTNYINQVVGWFASNGPSYRLTEWFVYIANGNPDSYATAYEGISLLTDQTASATLSQYGQQYRQLALNALTPTATATP